MKTMLDTNIYNDTWFFNLSTDAKFLFLFLITNKACNLVGCYELPLSIISNYTKISEKLLPSIFLQIKEKVVYINGWVVIKNYEKYNPMRNPSIEISKNKQLALIPQKIQYILTGCRHGVDRVCTGSKETEREKETDTEENKPYSNTHKTAELKKKAHELIGKPV